MMKRVELIHCELGTHMWVTEDRLDEYKAAGHKLAADSSKQNEPKAKKTTKKK